MAAFAQAHPFALLVTAPGGIPQATALPVVVERAETGWRIAGHGARENPQLATLDQAEALVQFSGPHAYISPQLYDRAQSVPTWNYSAVQARGRARLVQDEAAGYRILEALIRQSEPGYLERWDTLNATYRERLFQAVLFFEIEVVAWDGAQKWSQDRAPDEQRRIAASLTGPDAAAGHLMQALLDLPAPL